MKRFLAMLLLSLILLSALLMSSCGKENGGGTENPVDSLDENETIDSEMAAIESMLATYDPGETAVDYVEVADQDFEGHEFKFLNSSSIYYMYVYLDPDMTGDVLDDTCYARNAEAEKKFNITITEETESYTKLANKAKTLILADEDVYDAMYIPSSQLTPLISEELFYDLMEIEELHIDQIWWDQPMIERNIIEDRLFFATSDLHLMAFEGIWCMYFNEERMIDLGLELPYQLALDGKWTFDELKKYCAAAASLNGDASFTFDINGNAEYGMVVHPSTSGYMAYGMGAESITRNESGRFEFTADTDPRYLSTWEQLIQFFGPNDGNVVFKVDGTSDLDPGGYYDIFMSNRALFLTAELKGATMLREWSGEFGLLPQPKYDVDQENYESCLMSDCLSFCIPHTNTNLVRTGMIVDYLTYESYKELLPRYYDIHVAVKALGKQESIDVLSIVRGTRGCVASTPFGWDSDLGAKMSNLVQNNEMSISSTLQTYKDVIISNINATYEEYPVIGKND